MFTVSRAKGQVLNPGNPPPFMEWLEGVSLQGRWTGERTAREELVSRNLREGLLGGGGSGW